MLSDCQDCNEAFVMDSSSLLAYLWGGPGGLMVQRILRQSSECGYRIRVAALDLLEAYRESLGEDSPLDEVVALLEQLPLEIVPFTENDAVEVARIALGTPEWGYGKSASLHLARSLGATLITTDESLGTAWERCLLVKGEEGAGGETDNNQSIPTG